MRVLNFLTERTYIALIWGAALLRAGLGWHFGFRPFDDTFITFRYALNISTGYGFVYNAGQNVLGTTTPLWTLILALLNVFHLPLAGGALALSLLADTATAILLSSLLRRLGYSRIVAGSAVLLFLSSFDYLSLARSGMETALFVLLIMATLHEITAHRYSSAGLLCGLACITRPEGAILTVVLLLDVWQHRRSASKLGAWLGLSALLICVGGWSLFAERTFGSVVPQSIVAKSFAVQTDPALASFSWQNLATFFLKGQGGGEIFARTFLQLNLAWTLLSVLALFGLAADYWRCRRTQNGDRFLILGLFPVGYIGGLALCHAFTWFPWYFGPVYPFYALLTAVGTSRLGQILPVPSRSARTVPAALVTVLLLGQLLAVLLVKLPHDRSYWVQGYVQAADVVPRSPTVTVAAFEIGAVGWHVWPAQVLDVTGLVTPRAVGVLSYDFIRTSRPDYIVLKSDTAADFLAHVQSQPWFVQQYELIKTGHDPYGTRDYYTYHMKPHEKGPGIASRASAASNP